MPYLNDMFNAQNAPSGNAGARPAAPAAVPPDGRTTGTFDTRAVTGRIGASASSGRTPRSRRCAGP